MTDAEVTADADGSAETAWFLAGLLAGRSCRDALKRTCEWHRSRGAAELVCTPPRQP